MKQFKISSQTNQGGAARHIINKIQEDGAIELRAVGPHATYRAIRAAAKANEIMFKDTGYSLICIPEFTPVIIDGREQTGIRILVRKG